MRRRGVAYELTIVLLVIIVAGLILIPLDMTWNYIYNWQVSNVNAPDLSNGVLYEYYIWHYLPFIILIGLMAWLIIRIQRRKVEGI